MFLNGTAAVQQHSLHGSNQNLQMAAQKSLTIQGISDN